MFGPIGVANLYALAEEDASFGLATYELVMKRKLPPEILPGRRNRPHDLFARDDVEEYLDALESAVALQLDELGDAGSFEIFATMRRLGHRLGLASWCGPEAASARHLDRLVPPFDRLDQGASFVRPASTLLTLATRRSRERRAMHRIEGAIGEILAERKRTGANPDDYLARIHASFSDLDEPERSVHTARDVMLIHMGAQSNLYAALAWTLVNLLLHPEHLERVRGGDDAWLELCANESIRLAQRSLTLRRVMKPLDFETEAGRFSLAPGVMIATMLSVTNPTAAPGLERFDPSHYDGRRLSKEVDLPARELVSTFGHGRHSCPAQRFSISAIRIALRRLLDRYEIEPLFHEAQPLRRQLGGVARAERPCRVRYRRHS